jgi:hypothetical protein
LASAPAFDGLIVVALEVACTAGSFHRRAKFPQSGDLTQSLVSWSDCGCNRNQCSSNAVLVSSRRSHPVGATLFASKAKTYDALSESAPLLNYLYDHAAKPEFS